MMLSQKTADHGRLENEHNELQNTGRRNRGFSRFRQHMKTAPRQGDPDMDSGNAGARQAGESISPRAVISREHAFAGIMLLAALFAVLPTCRAADLVEIKRLDEQVARQQKHIETVQSGIAAQQGRVEDSHQREMALLAELARIDDELAAEQEKLHTLEAEMARQDELTRDKKHQTATLLRDKENLRQHMEKRLAAYYRTGKIGLMNAVFAAEGLSDLLLIEDGFRFMLHHDRKVVNDYQVALTTLEEARKSLDAEKKRLGTLVEQVRLQQQKLTETQQERQQILARVQTEKALYQQAITELEQAEQELTGTLTALQTQAQKARSEHELQLLRDYPLKAFKKRKPAGAQGFAAEKGKLPPPVQGTVVRLFTQATDAARQSAAGSNGIDIDCPPGTDIHAIYHGKIVYAGAMRGYGNLIIIDHGNRYYSLVSGIGDILVRVNDTVQQRDTIGKSSLHTGELRESLHLEIRYNARPEDPLSWLDPAGVIISDASAPASGSSPRLPLSGTARPIANAPPVAK